MMNTRWIITGAITLLLSHLPAELYAQASLSVVYKGKQVDRVGTWGSARPNGKLDGQFRVTVNTGITRRVVSLIMLQSVDANGRPAGGQVWDTKPGGYWILGVYRAGRRLNPTDRNIRDVVRGIARYEIFGDDSGWFKPGQRFRVTVRFVDGVVATGTARVGGSPSSPAGPATLSAVYRGKTVDRVGSWSNGRPDGKLDGQFSLTLNTGGARRVVSNILVQSANSRGNVSGGHAWDTRPRGNWILGVYRDGRRLNPSDRDIRDVVQGRATYSLFANDSGVFKLGQHFRLTVHFQGGGKLVATARVNRQPAAPASTASLSARYRGKGADRVGNWSRAQPDGKPDGHFTVTLNTGGARRVVNHIMLQSANLRGTPAGGQIWDTKPGGYWILGVYRSGRRLNPTDRNLHDTVQGVVRYEIYGNDSGWFKKDQNFRVTVRFAKGPAAVAFARVGAVDVAPPAASRTTLTAVYNNKLADRVGRGSSGRRNGQPDGHFTVKLDTRGARKVVSFIGLWSANNAGRPSGGQVWDTKPGGYWILGVYRNGRRLNPTDREIRDAVQGVARYELYGNDSGWFKTGQNFRVEVRFTDRTSAVAFARVGRGIPSSGPARVTASYRGMRVDRVGRGSSGKPNGQLDGHFSVAVDTRGARRIVNYIALHSADAKGRPSGGQVWDTTPGGYWILGVFRNGRRLNPVDRKIHDGVQGVAHYEIYGNDSGWFKPGRNFRITVGFLGGGQAVAFARVGKAYQPPGGAGRLTASYRGKRTDRVGRGNSPRPNGQLDGRFSLRLDTGRVRRVVSSIILESADSSGRPAGGQVWDTRPNSFWILGVYRGNRRLNPIDRNINDPVQDVAHYEIYGNDSGYFKRGQNFRITVHFARGGKAVAFARVP